MKKEITFILFIITINLSYLTLFAQVLQKPTIDYVEIGTIGKSKQAISTKKFITTSIPQLKHKIRIHATVLNFNKIRYKRYRKSAKKQNSNVDVNYIDSILDKPKYVKLEIIDKVQLLQELNEEYNTTLQTYLQNSTLNKLIVDVLAYLDNIDLNNLSKAEEIYLVNNKPKKYTLELIKSGKSFAMIDLSKTITFGYTTASFCWKKENGKVIMVNFLRRGNKCVKSTYKKVSKLEKKVNYLKL